MTVMMEQQTLNGFVDIATPPEATTQRRFEAFHQANGWVGDCLMVKALGLAGRGHRFGVQLLLDSLKLEWLESHGSDDPWPGFDKNYTSRYARWLVASAPGLNGHVRTRELKAQ